MCTLVEVQVHECIYLSIFLPWLWRLVPIKNFKKSAVVFTCYFAQPSLLKKGNNGINMKKMSLLSYFAIINITNSTARNAKQKKKTFAVTDVTCHLSS